MLALLRLGCLALALPAQARGRDDMNTASLLAESRALQKDLREVERDARGKRVEGREIREGLQRMSSRLDHLERSLGRVHRVQPPLPLPMDDASFRGLRHAVERAPFGRDRLAVISTAASTNLFLVPQVLSLTSALGHSEERIAALQILWPRVLDRQNAHLLYDVSPFPSDRRRVAEILSR